MENLILNKFAILDDCNNTLLSAMTVSKINKILFFHIGKTGGSSIVKLLKKNRLDDGILTNKKLSFEKKKKYFIEVVKEWDSYYKFVFVRNKYDLLVSLYNMNLRVASLPENLSFDKFIYDYVGCTDEYKLWLDQYNLTHINNKCIFDFIGNFENYNEDLDTVCKKINIINTGIRVNVGNYNKNQKYYNADLRKNVQEKFREEFDHFNWVEFQKTNLKLKKQPVVAQKKQPVIAQKKMYLQLILPKVKMVHLPMMNQLKSQI